MKKTNIAVVGYGGMGGFHTHNLIPAVSDLNLTGIYDIKQERCDIAREKGLFIYDSYDALLADPQVDLVLVAIPNDVHKEVCIRAMDAGKNVVCEKPAALSSAEFGEMVAAAECNGVKLFVHQNRRWDGDYVTVKRMLQKNELGEIFSFESRVHGSRGIPGDWRNEKAHGGGMILDWGVHLLDQAAMITDMKITKVYCELTNITNDEVDDGFKVLLTYENGMTALVEVGTNNFISFPRWYVLGVNGTAVLEPWTEEGKIVKVDVYDEGEVTPIRTAAGLTKTMAPRDEKSIHEQPVQFEHPDLGDFYRNVCGVIQGTVDEPIVKNCEVMRVMKLMEACFESARTNQVIFFEK